MTIAESLNSLKTAKSEILTAIVDKGGTIAPEAGISEFAAGIKTIPSSVSDSILLQMTEGTLTEIESDATNIKIGLFENVSSLKKAILPKCTYIFNNAFRNSGLESIVAPQLTGIHSSAFENTKITSIDVSKITILGTKAFYSTPIIEIDVPLVTTTNADTFYKCESLKRAAFPSTTNLKNSFFHDCINLEEVYAPLVNILYSNTFYNCKKLSKVDFPLLSTLAGISTFAYCELLREAIFPLVISLGYSSLFQGCTLLEKVDCAALSISSTNLFADCVKLSTLILRNTTKVCSLNNLSPFTNSGITASTGYIYVPKALLASYKTATNWVTFASRFRAIEDYPSITGGL